MALSRHYRFHRPAFKPSHRAGEWSITVTGNCQITYPSVFFESILYSQDVSFGETVPSTSANETWGQRTYCVKTTAIPRTDSGSGCNFREKLDASAAVANAEVSSGEASQALLKVADQQLEKFVITRYPRLTTRWWGAGYRDRDSYGHGVADGGNITLHREITHRLADPLVVHEVNFRYRATHLKKSPV